MSAQDADALAVEFERHRPYLLSLAYRLTSSWADAEDVVSETWPRWHQYGTGVDVPRAWLTTTVSRLCLDRLRSASYRREQYVGPWLPEPLVQLDVPDRSPPDPADIVVQDESVRLAFLMVLDQLDPEQRIALVMHDVLDLPFDQIAGVLRCSSAAARQHASRGRRRIARAEVPPPTSSDEARRVLDELADALNSGDVDTLTSLLAPDVVLLSDSAGEVYANRRALHGADEVTRFLTGLARRYGTRVEQLPALVNGEPGFAVRLPPGPPKQPRFGVYLPVVEGGLVRSIYAVVAPDKLRNVPGSPYASPPKNTHHRN